MKFKGSQYLFYVPYQNGTLYDFVKDQIIANPCDYKTAKKEIDDFRECYNDINHDFSSYENDSPINVNPYISIKQAKAIEKVRSSFENNKITLDQECLLTTDVLNPSEIMTLLKFMEKGYPQELIEPMIKVNYGTDRMNCIMNAYEQGVSVEKLRDYAYKDFIPYEQVKENIKELIYLHRSEMELEHE